MSKRWQKIQLALPECWSSGDEDMGKVGTGLPLPKGGLDEIDLKPEDPVDEPMRQMVAEMKTQTFTFTYKPDGGELIKKDEPTKMMIELDGEIYEGWFITKSVRDAE